MDKRPKRRKSKDNPYKLESNRELNIYKVTFKDSKDILRIIEINKEIYETLDRFELDDLIELNEYDRHIEHSEVFEITLNKRAIEKSISIDEQLENNIINEQIRNALDSLSDVQRRRIKLYYFDGLTQQEIADKEGVSLRAVQYTLNSAINELKKILKNFKNWLRKMSF